MAVHIKNEHEIEAMRTAGRLAAEVLDMITEHVVEGVSTAELDRLCHRHIVEEQGAVPAPLDYRGFPKSICTSINEEVCHGIPGRRRLAHGDAINIDVTVIKNGFHGDTSRMFRIGTLDEATERIVQVSCECLRIGIETVRPGAHLGDIGHAIQQHAERSACSVVREFCGHGIGRAFHEDPQVLHYGAPGTGLRIEAGMTFTIEPMINAGSHEIVILPDGWTAVTRDARPSAQWEHTILVTHDGHEVLTT